MTDSINEAIESEPQWPWGSGEMSRLVRSFAWAGTPLGAVEDLPDRMRAVVEQVLASPMVATVALGPDRLLVYNEEAARLYGDRHPEALGRPLATSFPDSYPAVEPLYDRIFAGESVRVAAQPLAVGTASRDEVFDAYLTPVRDGAGGVIGALMVGFEVGERARADAALRMSEERYRAFVTASTDVVYRMSADWTEMRQLDGRGFLADTLQPSNNWMDEYIYPEDQHDVQAAIDAAIDAKGTFELEHHVRQADGTVGWTMSRAVPILAADGSIREWLGTATDATRRHRTEKALRRSEERLRAVFDQAPMAIALTGRSGEILLRNSMFDRLWGRQPHETTARTYSDVYEGYYPDGRPIPSEEWPGARALIKGETVHDEVLLIVDLYGRRVPCSSDAGPVRDDEGGVIGAIVMFRDVTEDVAARRALQESEALRRVAQAGGRMGSWRWDLASRTVQGDAQFLALWGLPPSDEPLPLAVFTARQSESGVAQTEAVVTKAIAEGEEFDAEVEVVSGPTAGRWLRWRGRAAPGDDAVLHGVSFDITEQRHADAALRESEERLREVLNSMAEGFALFDADFTIIDVNDATLELDGRTREELVGRSHWEAFPGSEDSPVGELFKRVMRDRTPGSLEHVYNWPDGRLMWIDVRAYPNPAGRVACFWHDITKEKEAAEALRKSEERQVFLLKLSDVLRPIGDPVEIQGEAARLLGEHLGAGGCNYVEVDPEAGDWVIHRDYRRDGLPSIAQRYRREDWPLYGEDFLRGEPMSIPDIGAYSPITPEERAATEALGLVAIMIAPIVKRGRFVGGMAVTDSKARAWTPDDMALAVEVAERTWAAVERARVEAALRASEARQHALIEGVPQLVWRAAVDGSWMWASGQWTEFTGQTESDSRGWGWLDSIHSDDRERMSSAWHGAEGKGEFTADCRVCHAEEKRYRWFQSRATPVRDHDGAIVEWFGTSTDVDDLRALQDRQQVMVKELQHRTRNLITVVRALSKQTLTGATSLPDFEERFNQRLAALSRVQDLLSHLTAGKRVSFDELLGSELSALGAPEGKVTLDGPAGVPLRSATVQTFSLALHELATNALKYGALAAPAGHLTVRWSVTGAGGDRPRLQVDWCESGVDLTHVADRARGGGYGRELIERALPYQLDAETSFEMTADGVHCTVDVPISTTQVGSDGQLEHGGT